jgi:pSer/pThr/pTyr-binding forkhead associated (FHA) protein
MARLSTKSSSVPNQLITLKLGVNRIGRSPDCDFQIAHDTVSSLHCELVLSDGGVILRDLESTNGTFVEGRRVREVKLVDGQTIRVGDVELLVETTDAKVAIPLFENPELPVPPVVNHDGGIVCPRHSHVAVTHQCPVCKEVMCEACVHRLRRKGGKNILLLCPICSNAVEPIGGPAKKKKSLLARVGETVKLKFTRGIRTHAGDR